MTSSTAVIREETPCARSYRAFMRRGSRGSRSRIRSRCASAHRAHGVNVADARIESALMGLSSSMRMGTSEQDAFASAVAMVTLTLRRFDEEAI